MGTGRSENQWRKGSRGFSLLELLIVLGVTAMLLAILMPSFSRLRETARQVACASNLRQIGMGVASYADDTLAGAGHLPGTQFARSPIRQKEMMVLVVVEGTTRGWDGVGKLLGSSHISSPEIFYCPSHYGDHSFTRYEDEWASVPGIWRTIFSNYHYRGLDPDPYTPRPIDDTNVETLQRKQVGTWGLLRLPIMSDGLRTRKDYNHVTGNNMLNLDLTVTWFEDSNRRVYNSLPENTNGGWQLNPWVRFDRFRGK